MASWQEFKFPDWRMREISLWLVGFLAPLREDYPQYKVSNPRNLMETLTRDFPTEPSLKRRPPGPLWAGTCKTWRWSCCMTFSLTYSNSDCQLCLKNPETPLLGWLFASWQVVVFCCCGYFVCYQIQPSPPRPLSSFGARTASLTGWFVGHC